MNKEDIKKVFKYLANYKYYDSETLLNFFNKVKLVGEDAYITKDDKMFLNPNNSILKYLANTNDHFNSILDKVSNSNKLDLNKLITVLPDYEALDINNLSGIVVANDYILLLNDTRFINNNFLIFCKEELKDTLKDKKVSYSINILDIYDKYSEYKNSPLKQEFLLNKTVIEEFLLNEINILNDTLNLSLRNIEDQTLSVINFTMDPLGLLTAYCNSKNYPVILYLDNKVLEDELLKSLIIDYNALRTLDFNVGYYSFYDFPLNGSLEFNINIL